MTNTSRWAYEEIKKTGYIGKRQALYLAVFTESSEPLTHKQATNKVLKDYGVRMPERNGRIAELTDMGMLKVVDTVVCEFTRKTVQRWIWTGRRKPFEKKFKSVRCSQCLGKGYHMQEVYEECEKQPELFKL